MKKILAVILFLLIASPAIATTRWVFTSATGTGLGTDSLNCMTLASANAATVAGDIIRFRHATGYGTLAPAVDGTSGAHIIAIGDTLYPASIQISGMTWKNYVSLYGVSATVPLLIGSAGTGANNDSVLRCIFTHASNNGGINTSNNVISRSSISCKRFELSGASITGCDTSIPITGNIITDCTINAFSDDQNGNPIFKFTKNDGGKFIRTRFYLTARAGAGNGMMKFFFSSSNQFTDCRVIMANFSPSGDESGFFYVRDNSNRNRFVRDTLDWIGPEWGLMLANGSGVASCDDAHYNTWSNCLFRNKTPVGPSSSKMQWMQAFTRADTIEYCTFIGNLHAPFDYDQAGDSVVVRHNTCVYLGGDGPYSLTNIGGAGYTKDNIFYAPFSTQSSIHHDTAEGSHTDYNLYYGGGGSSRAIRETQSTSYPLTTSCNSYGSNCHSIYGDPIFVFLPNDTTIFTADLRLSAGSPGIGTASDGTNMGAYQASSSTGPKVYYIKSSGNDGLDGLSYATAWATIYKSNRTTRPGDVVYVYDGIYNDPIKPDSAGSNPNGLIRYIGASNGSDPTLNRGYNTSSWISAPDTIPSYISINGLRFTALVTASGDRDSIKNCRFDANVTLTGNYTDFRDSYLLGSRISMGKVAKRTKGTTLSWCIAYGLGIGITTSPAILSYIQLDSCTVSYNRFTLFMEPLTTSATPQDWDHVNRSTWKSNKLNITNNSTLPLQSSYALRMRDSTMGNTIRRDTIYVDGSNGCSIYPTISVTPAYNAFNGPSTVDSCVWNLSSGNSTVQFNNVMSGWTFTNNIIATHFYPAISINCNPTGTSTFNHNTLISDATHGVVDIGGWDRGTWVTWPDGALTFTNNILYLYSQPIINDPIPQFVSDPGSYNWPMGIVKDIMGAATLTTQTKLNINYNLYSYYGYQNTRADRSIVIKNASGTYLLNGAPGSFTSSWNFGANDKYGTPWFIDSTLTATFNPYMCQASAAIGAGSSGSNIGAVGVTNKVLVSVTPTSIVWRRGTTHSDTIQVWNLGTDDIESDPTPYTTLYPVGVTRTVGGETQITASQTIPYIWELTYDGIGAVSTGSFKTQFNYPVNPPTGLPFCGQPNVLTIPLSIVP